MGMNWVCLHNFSRFRSYRRLKMKIVGEFKYAVIQFLEQPCSSIDDYICIPQSWIRVRRVTDRKSLVAYPSESPALIEKRVKKAEMVSEKWTLYMAIVKHETNSYEDANNYIVARRYDSSTEKSCSRTISTEHELLPATTTEINSSSRSSSSSSRKRIKQSNNHQKRLKVVDDAKLTSLHSSPSPAMVAGGNTLHFPMDPLILANQISQGVYLQQGNQQSSSYQDHLQRIVLNHEIHRRTISNLQSLLPDFLTNQKCSQGSRQTTYTVHNPTNVANQFSQTPNSSSVNKDHSQVLLTQEIPVSQSSIVNCTKYVPSSYSEAMYVPSTSVSTSNSEGQSTFPTQYLDVNQPPVDGSHLHQDPSVEEVIVDGSTEVNCIEQSVSSENCTENEPSAIPNSQNQSIECSMKRSPPVDKVTKDGGSSTQDVDDVNEQSTTEMSTDEILTSQIPFDQEGLSVNSITNIDDLWLDRMADLFERMNSDFLNTCKMAHEMHESLVQSAKTFQSIASVSANLRKLKSKATVGKPKEVTVERKEVAEKEQVEKEKEKSDMDMAEKDDNQPKKIDDNKKVAKKKHVQKKEKEKSDMDMTENKDDSEPNKSDDNDGSSKDDKNTDKNKDDDENKDEDGDNDEETPKKIRGSIRAFVLPPEYDPKDTKWTLKYRKPDSKIKKLGLVELVEKSRVYINAFKLAHCKRVSKDAKTLARMLLVEIFSQNALSVCSLTGAKANAFDMNGTNVRPGLDEHARMVILSFAEEHARLKGWGPFDTQSVVNSIRSKIQEIRAKYGQT